MEVNLINNNSDGMELIGMKEESRADSKERSSIKRQKTREKYDVIDLSMYRSERNLVQNQFDQRRGDKQKTGKKQCDVIDLSVYRAERDIVQNLFYETIFRFQRENSEKNSIANKKNEMLSRRPQKEK